LWTIFRFSFLTLFHMLYGKRVVFKMLIKIENKPLLFFSLNVTSDVVPFDPLFLNLLVRFTTIHLDPPLSDSQRYTWILCPIHNGTLGSFVRFTTVHFDPLSDSQRYTLILCPIKNKWYFLSICVFFTNVTMKQIDRIQHFSDSTTPISYPL